MAKRKPPQPPEGLPAWMATYSDLVTLLLCFFVLLYGMSTVNEEKLKAFSYSFGEKSSIIDMGSEGMTDIAGNGIIELPEYNTSVAEQKENYDQMQENFDEVAEALQNILEEKGLSESIAIEVSEQSIHIDLSDNVLFDSGKADLTDASLEILEIIVSEMLQYPESHIRIEGHTDNRKINTPEFSSNYRLSAARAIAVAEFFEGMGYLPARIDPVAKGEFEPIDTNSTEEGRARNRRVEIIIMSEYFAKGIMTGTEE